MSVRAFNLTLNGAVQDSIYSALAAVAANNLDSGKLADSAYRLISFQPAKANTNDINIGVTGKTIVAIRLDPGDTAPPVILQGGINAGMRLSEFSVQGTNAEVLQILCIE